MKIAIHPSVTDIVRVPQIIGLVGVTVGVVGVALCGFLWIFHLGWIGNAFMYLGIFVTLIALYTDQRYSRKHEDFIKKFGIVLGLKK